MTKPQVILDDGGEPAFAVIPWREYVRLEMMDADAGLTDEELYDQAKSVGGGVFSYRGGGSPFGGRESCQSIPGASRHDPKATGPFRRY